MKENHLNKIAKAKFYLNTSLGLTSWLTCQQIPPKYAKNHKNAHSGPRGKSQTSFFCIFDLTIGFLASININGDVPTMKLVLFDKKYCCISSRSWKNGKNIKLCSFRANARGDPGIFWYF